MAQPALLFDLDGTLLDTLPDIAASVNAVRAMLALPPRSLAEVREAVGHGLESLLLESLGHDASAAVEHRLPDLMACYRAHHETHLFDQTRPYPGVADGLRELQAGGYAMAVVSNKPEAFCRKLVQHYGFDQALPVVLGSDSAGERKPSPAPLLLACARLRAPVATAWMIGDSPGDLLAGAAAGCAERIAVTWGYRTREILVAAPATRVVDDFPSLVALL